MSILNIGYFRVSKEDESEQDLNRHIEVTLNKFNVDKKDITIFKERISGYNLKKLSKRTQFLEVLRIIFNSDKITIEDVFSGNLKPSYGEVNIYTYDYNRFSRRMEYNVLFSLMCDLCKVNIYSFNQPHLFRTEEEHLTQKMSRLLFLMITAYSSESYSHSSSQNIRKSVKKDGNLTVGSKKGVIKKWGRRVYDLNGKELTLDQIKSVNERIKTLLQYKTYDKIKNILEHEFNWRPANSYISKIKKGDKNSIRR